MQAANRLAEKRAEVRGENEVIEKAWQAVYAGVPAAAERARSLFNLYTSSSSDMGRYAAGATRMPADVGFYPSRWARYETTVAGTPPLSPREDQLAEPRRDYAAMGMMILGEVVGFAELEQRINGEQAARQ